MTGFGQFAFKDQTLVPQVAQRFEAALSFHRHGRLDKAEALYKEVLRRAPAHVETIYRLGLIAKSRGRATRAIQFIERAAILAPDRPDILCDLGLLLKEARRFNEATACHERVVGIMPGSAEAFSNLGTTYAAWGKFDAAILALEKADALNPENAEIVFNLGNAFLAADRPQEAEAALRRAIEQSPAHARARINLGNALKDQGRLEDAVVAFRTALVLAPEDAEAHWNLGLALLASGNYADGWREYEWRRRIPGFAMRRFQIPAWDGAALGERTLLVHAEQGLGDTLQFIRYVTQIEAPSDQIVLLCPQRLKPFLTSNHSIAVVGSDDPLPRADVEAPLLSLPHLLGGIAPKPMEAYLKANPARVSAWRQRLEGERRFKIGIAWQGNPHYKADRRRSPRIGRFGWSACSSASVLSSSMRCRGAARWSTSRPSSPRSASASHEGGRRFGHRRSHGARRGGGQDHHSRDQARAHHRGREAAQCRD
ncbi:MAG: tetratricopeptide repeat protein [Rhodospirillales bacterium]|nr:tetratricopeptide repeat protein [Rhodospirillales bacterium]